MRITKEEWMLAGSFALLGAIFSMRGFIEFLNTLNPVTGLLFYYGIITVTLFILSYFGLAIFNIKVEKPLQILGATLIIFAFFTIFNFENPYVQIIFNGDSSNVAPAFYGSEDGALWYAWSNVTNNTDTLRILTFIVSPFLLALLGGLLLERRVNLSP